MSFSTKHRLWGSVLTCFDTFKGTLTACEACLAIERAFCRVESGVSAEMRLVHCPMSDGGAGLLGSLLFATHSPLSSSYNFTRVEVPTVSATCNSEFLPPLVLGPLGEPLNHSNSNSRPYFACDVASRVVVVEMAVTSGLPIVPEGQRNPLLTTSYGVGQLIRYAVEYVANEHRQKNGPDVDCGVTLFLGIGGSATNDGGLGALQALGLELLVADANGGDSSVLTTPFTGGDLERLVGARFSPAFRQMFFCGVEGSTKRPYCKEVRLIGDVASPLLGPDGATSVFGPQKCSSSWDKAYRARVLLQLERGMFHAASMIVRSSLHGNVADGELLKQSLASLCHAPGGGGAGGMSGFFCYIVKALWMPGADLVAELLGLPEKLKQCDCVITGEGSFDDQTIRYNKTLGRLLQMVVMENLRRRSVGQKIIEDAVVICGRTSYQSSEEVRSLLLDCVRQKETHSDVAALAAAVPQVHLLSLTPHHFSVPEALGNAAVCVEERMRRFLTGEEKEMGRVPFACTRRNHL